jgi:hypothetical protein
MSPTRFPSIDNRMKRSLPKFGARCTINRAVFPLGVGAGVGVGRALAFWIAPSINSPAQNEILTATLILFIRA